VSGIGDELIVERERRPLVGAIGIEGFENRLLAVLERTVADQQPEAAGGEEVAMWTGQAGLSLVRFSKKSAELACAEFGCFRT
jgi:hypothetical protein